MPDTNSDYIRQRVIPEKNAILVSYRSLPHVKTHELTRRWDKVADPHMSEAVRLLQTHTSAKNKDPSIFVSDPIASNEVFPGLYALSKAEMDKKGDVGGILEVLSEVYNISTDGELTGIFGAGLFRKTMENEILELFDLRQGEGDSIVYVFGNIAPTAANETYLMTTVSDATLVSTLADATYSYLKRRWDRRDDRNTATFMVAFRKVSWNTWGHDSYAADITDYANAGANNEEEIIRKTWLWIRNADLATAVSNCRAGTNVAAESGYIITDVQVNDNRNGSFHITQVQRKQINDKDESGAEVLNHHAINTGTATIVTTVFENFTSATLPAGDAIGTNVISNVPKIQPNGLWSRRVITFTPTWANTWSGKVRMGEQSAAGYRLQEQNEATGVSEANRATAYTAAQSASGATRVVLMTRLIERANGERIIQQEEGYISESTDESEAKVIDLRSAVAGQEQAVGRVWHRRSTTAKNTLIGTGGAAITGFTYAAVAYTQYHTTVQDNGDGTWDVHQLGIVPGGRLWTVRGEDSTEKIVRVYEAMYYSAGVLTNYLVTEYRTLFATAALAAAYADNSSAFEQDDAGNERTLGRIEYLGNSLWAGYCVLIKTKTAAANAWLTKGDDWTLPSSPA